MATHNLIISRIKPIFLNKIPKTKNPINCFTPSTSLFPHKPLNSMPFLQIRVHSVYPHNSSKNPSKTHFIIETFILCIFTLTLLSLRCISNVLLPDFAHRWNQLVSFSEEAEAKVRNYPSHLWHAVVAYEDRRFFTHFGIDPIGISRAMLSFSARGGGSTITQQLVKNIFLKNERTILRKAVEMALALALERKISKLKILSSYLSKIYWGHGLHGIELASKFYFGKHPCLLSLGECALLAGIIPAPELRSPFRDSSRGKIFQARVLKRMVEVGFLDIETALLAVKQPLHLRSIGPNYADEIFLAVYSLKELGVSVKHDGGTWSTVNEVWDWERESKIWEVIEHFERWALIIEEGKKKEEGKGSPINFGS